MKELTTAERAAAKVIIRRCYTEDQKEEAIKYLFSLYGSFMTRKVAENAWNSITF